MNRGNSNQQQAKQTVIELTQELMQKQLKLEKLMLKSAQKRTSNGKQRSRLAIIKHKLANAHATKNEIAKVCNSSSDWLKQTQKKLDTCTDAINSAKQHVNGLNELNEQEIRRLESELANLPTEDELQQHAMKVQEQEKELADLNKKIKEMEVKFGDGDNVEMSLLKQIRELQQANAEMEKALPEQPEPEHQPTNPEPAKLHTQEEKGDFLAKYFNVPTTKKGTTSADVTSTKNDPHDKKSDPTRYICFSSDGSSSS